MAELYREPIESYLEKASLSKPRLSARPPRPPKPRKPKTKKRKTEQAVSQSESNPTNETNVQPTAAPTEPARGPSPVTKRLDIAQRKTVMKSLIEKNGGVLEVTPQLEELYSAQVTEFFPDIKGKLDAKGIIQILGGLEAEGGVKRMMLSAVAPTGTKLYNSVVVLPDIDSSHAKIVALQEALQTKADSFMPTFVQRTQNSPNPAENGKESHPAVQTVLKTNKRRRGQEARESAEGVSVDDTPKKRIRTLTYKPHEDRILYQAVALLKKYVGFRPQHWKLLEGLFPNRKDESLRRRAAVVKEKKGDEIARFMTVFERKYNEDTKVKRMQRDEIFDLNYYLDWYNSNNFEEEERWVVFERYHSDW